MRNRPSSVPLSRRQAAAALEGDATGDAHLDQVLAALAAPPTERELAGESAARARFAAAVPARAVARVPAGRPTRAARRATVVGLAAGMLATGGIAYASSGGHLPGLLGGSAPASTVASSQATRDGGTAGGGPGSTPPSHPAASPTPSVRGLCRAYQAGVATNGGKALSGPAFSALVTKAGGTTKVAAYCATLVGPPGTRPSPTSQPGTTHPVHPTRPAKPTQAASPAHPAGPSHSPKPTQAANPSRPPKPTQAATPKPKQAPGPRLVGSAPPAG